MQTVLSIAGSDCSGGAGIQADLKTFMAHKIYGMSVITALTAQNTLGVTDVLNISEDMIAHQLDAIFTDIFPDAIKIGMVSVKETISLIAFKLHFYEAKNIVIDPIMLSTSGHQLINQDAIDALLTTLFPLATLITPNIPEAEALCGFKIANKSSIIKACKVISKLTPAAILIKGGHALSHSNDYLYQDGELIVFPSAKIATHNTHGTGCTLSSAIASNLALGFTLEHSTLLAKQYVFAAISSELNLGHGNGPINHCI